MSSERCVWELWGPVPAWSSGVMLGQMGSRECASSFLLSGSWVLENHPHSYDPVALPHSSSTPNGQNGVEGAGSRWRQWKGPWTTLCRVSEAWDPDLKRTDTLVVQVTQEAWRAFSWVPEEPRAGASRREVEGGRSGEYQKQRPGSGVFSTASISLRELHAGG